MWSGEMRDVVGLDNIVIGGDSYSTNSLLVWPENYISLSPLGRGTLWSQGCRNVFHGIDCHTPAVKTNVIKWPVVTILVVESQSVSSAVDALVRQLLVRGDVYTAKHLVERGVLEVYGSATSQAIASFCGAGVVRLKEEDCSLPPWPLTPCSRTASSYNILFEVNRKFGGNSKRDTPLTLENVLDELVSASALDASRSLQTFVSGDYGSAMFAANGAQKDAYPESVSEARIRHRSQRRALPNKQYRSPKTIMRETRGLDYNHYKSDALNKYWEKQLTETDRALYTEISEQEKLDYELGVQKIADMTPDARAQRLSDMPLQVWEVLDSRMSSAQSLKDTLREMGINPVPKLRSDCESRLLTILRDTHFPALFDPPSSSSSNTSNNDSDVWVECNSCETWRRLPACDERVKRDENWMCCLSSDPYFNVCDAPQEYNPDEENKSDDDDVRGTKRSTTEGSGAQKKKKAKP
jgi:hypothetical protein